MQISKKNELKYLTLKLTNKCNLNCIMCGQVYSNERKKNGELEFETITQNICQLDSLQHVYLFGGEPLLYKDFIPLIKFLYNKNISTRITTNGTLLDKYAQKIVENKVRNLEISVDSHKKEIFEKIRGQGTFERIQEGLQHLIYVKKLTRSQMPHLTLNCVILPYNVNDLVELQKYYLEKFPEIENINFEFPIITNSKIGNRHEEIMKKEFNCTADSWKCFYDKIPVFSEEEINILFEQVDKLKSIEKVSVKGPSNLEEIKEALSNSFVIPERLCDYPFATLSILPNGKATFCTDFPDYIVGNLYDKSITEIWEGNKCKKLRKYFMENGNLPLCSKCPHRYEVIPIYEHRN